MNVTFSVACVPVAQPRQRHRVIQSGGRAFATNYTPTKDPVNAFKAAVQLAFSAAYDGPPTDDPVSMTLTFLMPRPKRMIWKTKPMPRVPHASKPDGDNLEKAVLDALEGIAFRNDSQVWMMDRMKLYAAGDEQLGVDVTIRTREETNG